MVDTLIGEVCVWLGALVFWLWPAYVRHRLLWALWFWLHPSEVTAHVIERPERPRLAVAKPNNFVRATDWWDEPSEERPGLTRRQALDGRRYNIATDQFEYVGGATTTIAIPIYTATSCAKTFTVRTDG